MTNKNNEPVVDTENTSDVVSLKDLADPDQEMARTEVERPGVVNIKMPWDLYKLLNWGTGDGLNWTYIDEDRVLIQRIKQEGGEPIPEGTFTPVAPEKPEGDAVDTPIRDSYRSSGGSTLEELEAEERLRQEERRKKALENPVPKMTQDDIDKMVEQDQEEFANATREDGSIDLSKISSAEKRAELKAMIEAQNANLETAGQEPYNPFDVPEMTDEELEAHHEQMLEKYSTTVVNDEGEEVTVQRYEPEDGIKKGTPEWDAEVARMNKLGRPPELEEDPHEIHDDPEPEHDPYAGNTEIEEGELPQ